MQFFFSFMHFTGFFISSLTKRITKKKKKSSEVYAGIPLLLVSKTKFKTSFEQQPKVAFKIHQKKAVPQVMREEEDQFFVLSQGSTIKGKTSLCSKDITAI